MFELMRSVSIDAENGRASGAVSVPADHPLFADHFPGKSLLPGSLILELAAQVADHCRRVRKTQLDSSDGPSWEWFVMRVSCSQYFSRRHLK